jgi:tetratricopeptide (TPR) repeat protein
MMASIEERLEKAKLRLQQRQYRSAVKLLRGILQDAPETVDAMKLLANVALAHNRPEMARELLVKVVALRPRSAISHLKLGIALQRLGKLDDATAQYKRALLFNRKNSDVHFHLGTALAAKGQVNQAAHCYQRAIHYRPKFTQAHYKLATLLYDAGAVNAAALEFQRVLELEPRRDDAFVDLGNALRRCDKHDDALACFRRALELNPRSISALNNLSNLIRDRGRPRIAAKLMRRAVEIDPLNPILHNGLGLAVEPLGRLDEARACYRKALELRPSYANAHYNLAGLFHEQGDLQQAEMGYQTAVECDAQKAEAHYRLACLWLLHGKFADAWPKYEWRWKMEESRGKNRDFSSPAWDGGSLEGKRILLYAEQGLGDALQFVRYARLVKARGATVLLECPQRLVQLLTSCSGIDSVIEEGRRDGLAYDLHAALMSLPGLLGTTLANIPSETPYLSPEPSKVEQWRAPIAAIPGFRVGIAWQGKKTYLRDAVRSIPLKHFARLTEVPEVQLVKLQKGYGSDQLKDLHPNCTVRDLGPDFDSGPDAFADAAAVMKHLDLIITSDTSIAHLAGALGVPVWVALPYVPEWRWLLNREDSPWYPTMRLFRQPALHDWEGTFDAISRSLRELIAR